MKRCLQMYFSFLLLLSPFMGLEADEISQKTKLDVNFAYYVDDNKGDSSSGGWIWPNYAVKTRPDDFVPIGNDDGRDLGSGWGSAEIEAILSHTISVPFLRGEGGLTSSNSLDFTFKGVLTPVSAGVESLIKWTPIAFLNFEAGVAIGSGWDFFGIFNGLGLNTDGSGNPTTDSFNGFVSQAWLAGTFQFDLAALVPGEWNHVVVMANGKFPFNYYNKAEKEQAWQWRGDAGENFNGLSYKGSYILGYQMPKKINFAGLILETSQRLGDMKDFSTMASDGWGSDFIDMRFGPLMNIELNKNNNLMILLQLKNAIKYTDETVYYNYFENRQYESTYIKFDRLALSYSLKF